MKAAKLQALLETKLGYSVSAQRGSHKKLVSSAGYPQLTFAFHDGAEVPPGLIRKILTKDVGISLDAAAKLLGLG
jgi:predicted RNA binding protein YcfA (HicA-like mRNA interferase family)